jgi:hypothetical protein
MRFQQVVNGLMPIGDETHSEETETFLIDMWIVDVIERNGSQ